jgi:hypothetical protein
MKHAPINVSTWFKSQVPVCLISITELSYQLDLVWLKLYIQNDLSCVTDMSHCINLTRKI